MAHVSPTYAQRVHESMSYFSAVGEFEEGLQSDPIFNEILSLMPVVRMKDISFISHLCSAEIKPLTFNRYEHSLGVAFLAARAADYLGIPKYESTWKAIVIAALLHDVGHTPFSHITEQFLVENRNRYHFHFSLGVIRDLVSSKSRISDLLEESYDVLTKQSHYSYLIHGLLSCDNLDGIYRSALFFRRNAEDPRIVLDSLFNKPDLKQLRTNHIWFLTKEIYEHELMGAEVLATEAMISRAMEIFAENDLNFINTLHQLSDTDLFDRLHDNVESADLINQLEEKKFYTPLWKYDSSLFIKVKKHWKKEYLSLDKRIEIAHWVAEKLNISHNDVIVYCKVHKQISPMPTEQQLSFFSSLLPQSDIDTPHTNGKQSTLLAKVRKRRRKLFIFVNPVSLNGI